MIFLVNGSSYLLYGFWIQSHSNLYLGLGKRTSERLYIWNKHAGTSPNIANTVKTGKTANTVKTVKTVKTIKTGKTVKTLFKFESILLHMSVFLRRQWPMKFEL